MGRRLHPHRPKAGRKGITCFIIKKGTPGFTARPFRHAAHRRRSPTKCISKIASCPSSSASARKGEGLNLCLDLLTRLRFPYSACNVGVGVAALRMAIDHAKTAQHVRRAALEAAGYPVDARGFGGRASRRAMADVGGRVESRSRRRLSHRSVDREALFERGAGARHRSRGADSWRLRRQQGVSARAMVSRGAHPPNRRRSQRSASDGHRARRCCDEDSNG